MTKLVTAYEAVRDEINSLGALVSSELIDRIFPASEAWAQPVRLIIGNALPMDASPSDIHAAILEALTQPEIPTAAGVIRIMSLHKSKGLSSPIVVIAACIQGVVPRMDTKESNPAVKQRTLREQRRLFYVGMTRAREKLILSSSVKWLRKDAIRIGVALKPKTGNREFGHANASQFLDEIGLSAPAALRGSEWLDGALSQ